MLMPPPPPMETQSRRHAFIHKPGGKTRPVMAGTLSQPISSTRLVRLKKLNNQPLGFSIRGGWEHGTGVYVSEVHRGSEADRQGLMAGDQILRVNGLSIEQAIHEEVIALIKSSSKVTLKVKSVGMVPVKDRVQDHLSWRLLNESNVSTFTGTSPPVVSGPTKAPCPIHSDGSWSGASSSSSSSSRRSSTSHLKSPLSATGANGPLAPIEECQVYLSLAPGQGLGCSVVKGPPQYPGIFVQQVKPHGVADEAGLGLGDQIVAVNGEWDFEFNQAIATIKAASQMTLTVRKRAGLGLFTGKFDKQPPEQFIQPAAKTIHKIRAVVHHPAGASSHAQICPKHSIGSNGSSVPSGSDRDLAIDEITKSGCKLHPKAQKSVSNGSNNGFVDPNADADPERAMEKVRLEEERLADERRKLEADQRRLREELDLLDKERKQLQTLRVAHTSQGESSDISSLSSASSSSGAQSLSGMSSASGSNGMVPSSAGSQMGFLDELKKLAERRSSSSDGLLTDTLHKTNRNNPTRGPGPGGRKLPLALGVGDEKRKQHDKLMEEFKSAHTRMFGKRSNSRSVTEEPLDIPHCETELSDEPNTENRPVETERNKNLQLTSENGENQEQQKAPTSEKVIILRTSSPTKRIAPPPPPPLPPSAVQVGAARPLVQIGQYQGKPNRFGSSDTNLVRINVTK